MKRHHNLHGFTSNSDVEGALTHLNQLADAAKVAKHPTVPTFALVKSKYSDKDANSLTTAIVDFCILSGHFATRLSSTGSYRADLGQFVPSKQRAGLPDVMAVVDGRSVFIEVKVGRDRLSQDQKETIADLEKAGAWVLVARDFQQFYEWFVVEFQTAPFA